MPSGTLGALNYLVWGSFECAQALLLVALAAKFGIRSAWRLAIEVIAIAPCTLSLAGYVTAIIGILAYRSIQYRSSSERSGRH